MSPKVFQKTRPAKKTTSADSSTIFADTDFNHYFDNKKRPISFRTMIPMCLWINKTDKLSRIDFPYVNKQTGTVYCDIEREISAQKQKLSPQERAKWKNYNYWVFNVFNLPPKPAGMSIFQATNKSKPPWNLIGLGNAGILGNPNSLINDAYIWENGIFTFLDQSDDNVWRFMTYTQAVPNTKMLYIYDTNTWNVTIDKNLLPDPKDILNSDKARYGAATPVGRDNPAQLYITPDPEPELTISSNGSSYIWVCEQEYTQFICPESIIIPYSAHLYKELNLSKSIKPTGYLTALKQGTQNMQNWIKYKSGSSNSIRSKLLSINYQQETNPSRNNILIIFSLILLTIITSVIIYLFKK
jgi:hypothetical protein